MSDEPEDRDASGLPPPPWGREITPLTEVCGGQYVLLHEIARGDLSVVYRAKPAGSRDALAFKVLQPRFVGDETQERRFRREAELLRRIEHPNVVRMVDHGTIEDGRDFVALELLAGRPLAEVLAEAERMSPERTCRIARQIARALRAMHNAGVIHRDLKPSNILLIGPEDAERVKLVDFGEAGDVGAPARRVKGSGRAESDVHEGPTYRPPEQQRKRPPQATMDVFALGVVMFEMLTGQHPFVEAKDKLGQTIRSKAFDAPEVFLGLVSDCIERSPRDRPQSMEEVLERIDKALLWMGVVPHELTTGDEDERTQPYVVADPGYADPAAQARPAAPPPSSRPKSPQDGATVAGEVVLSATDPFDEDLIQTQRRRIHVADEDDADDESDHMPTQRRRVGSDRPQEPAAFEGARGGRGRARGRGEERPRPDSEDESWDDARAAHVTAESWDDERGRPRIESHDESWDDARNGHRTADSWDEGSDERGWRSSETRSGERGRRASETRSESAEARRSTERRRGRGGASADGPSSDSAPSIDLGDLREKGAPTGPRFVVDTVAWTKQQPSAKPERERRRHMGKDEERPTPREASARARPRPPTAAQAPIDPDLPRWVLPLFVMVIVVLAYAVWVVWTQ